jgi:hypothetical protein
MEIERIYKKTSSLYDYKPEDKVQVFIDNARNKGIREWREGIVERVTTIYPSYGSHHPPYPIVFVKTIRTYFKSIPRYEFLGDSNIKIYVGDDGHFYDKENTEPFLYVDQVKPR